MGSCLLMPKWLFCCCMSGSISFERFCYRVSGSISFERFCYCVSGSISFERFLQIFCQAALALSLLAVSCQAASALSIWTSAETGYEPMYTLFCKRAVTLRQGQHTKTWLECMIMCSHLPHVCHHSCMTSQFKTTQDTSLSVSAVRYNDIFSRPELIQHITSATDILVCARSDIEAGAAYQDRLEGMIMRSQLLVLLQNQVFTDSQGQLLSGELPSQRLEMQLDSQMRSFYRTRYMHRYQSYL